MKSLKPILPFAMLALALQSAWLPLRAQPASTPAVSGVPAVVATVNGVAIRQSQLDEAVRGALQATHQPDTPQLRQAVKQQLITRELLRQNAEKAGYGARPEVQQAIDAARANTETQLYLKDNAHPAAITAEQVRARYDEIVATLGRYEYKPRLIAVPDAATAATVFRGLRAGRSFDALAQQYSVIPSRANGGELPWISFRMPVTEGKTQGLPLAVAQAITKLRVGHVTPWPVQAGNLRFIAKLDAKRPTQIPPFDSARESILQQLQAAAYEKAAEDFAAGQMKNATIQQ